MSTEHYTTEPAEPRLVRYCSVPPGIADLSPAQLARAFELDPGPVERAGLSDAERYLRRRVLAARTPCAGPVVRLALHTDAEFQDCLAALRRLTVLGGDATMTATTEATGPGSADDATEALAPNPYQEGDRMTTILPDARATGQSGAGLFAPAGGAA